MRYLKRGLLKTSYNIKRDGLYTKHELVDRLTFSALEDHRALEISWPSIINIKTYNFRLNEVRVKFSSK